MRLLLWLTCILLDDQKLFDSADSLYSAWQSNALKLNSAIVKISGSEKSKSGTKIIDINVAFDHLLKKEFISFFWSEYSSGIWIRSKNQITYMEKNGTVVNTINAHDSKLRFIKPYDLRYLPTAAFSHVEDGIDPIVQWNNVKNMIKSTNAQIRLNDKSISCEFFKDIRTGTATESRKLIVDFSHSSAPLISGFTLWRKMPPKIDWHKISHSQINYTSVNNLLLPTDFLINDKVTGSEIILKFSWTNVNEPIDDQIFDSKNFPVSDHAIVVDSRVSKGKPIVIGTIEPPTTVPTEQIATPSRFSPTTKLLIALVLIALVATAVYVAIRIANRPKSKS